MTIKYLPLLCLVFLFSACPVRAEDDLTVLYNDLPPLKYQERGEVKGVVKDVFCTIMERSGMPVQEQQMHATTWARVYQDTLNYPGTIAMAMAKTKEREPLFKWVGPVYHVRLGLIGRAGRSLPIIKPEDAAMYRVGGLRKTAPVNLLVRHGFPPMQMHYVTTAEQALKMVASNRLDLFAYSLDTAFYMLENMHMHPEEYAVYYEIKHKVDLYIALNRSFSDTFVRRMQDALCSMQRAGRDGMSEYDKILAKYGVLPGKRRAAHESEQTP